MQAPAAPKKHTSMNITYIEKRCQASLHEYDSYGIPKLNRILNMSLNHFTNKINSDYALIDN